jgi:hypothetical protein
MFLDVSGFLLGPNDLKLPWVILDHCAMNCSELVIYFFASAHFESAISARTPIVTLRRSNGSHCHDSGDEAEQPSLVSVESACYRYCLIYLCLEIWFVMARICLNIYIYIYIYI